MVIGCDIGGMSIKFGLVNSEGELVHKKIWPADFTLPVETIVAFMDQTIRAMCQEAHLSLTDIQGMGIGCPGVIHSGEGRVDFAGNLHWEKVPLVQLLSYLPFPIRLSNDANVAALAEATFGRGKTFSDFLFLTLGTGIGGGIILNHRLYEGQEGKGAELGHMILEQDGLACSCGLHGCFEAYASTSALIRQTKQAMENNPQSKMWPYVEHKIALVNGKTAFECAKQGDAVAQSVVKQYITYLSHGCLSLCNIFRPQAIIFGGGLSAQKEALLAPLKQEMEQHLYGFKHSPKVILDVSSMGNDAGIIGAACLVL